MTVKKPAAKPAKPASQVLKLKGKDAAGKPVEFSFPTAFLKPLLTMLLDYLKSPEGQAFILSLLADLFTRKDEKA